eukprot:2367096-Rhodomonas_salina.2
MRPWHTGPVCLGSGKPHVSTAHRRGRAQDGKGGDTNGLSPLQVSRLDQTDVDRHYPGSKTPRLDRRRRRRSWLASLGGVQSSVPVTTTTVPG